MPNFKIVIILLSVLAIHCTKPEKTTWDKIPLHASWILEANNIPNHVLPEKIIRTLQPFTKRASILLSSQLIENQRVLSVHLAFTEKAFKQWADSLINVGFDVNKISDNSISIQQEKDQTYYAQQDESTLSISTSRSILNKVNIERQEPPPTFKESHTNLFQYSTLDADSGNVYVNNVLIEDLLAWNVVENINWVNEKRMSAVFDITTGEQSLVLIGFTPKERDIFSEQKPQPNSLWPVVPFGTRLFIHYGLSDLSKLSQTTGETQTMGLVKNEIGYGILSSSQEDCFYVVNSKDSVQMIKRLFKDSTIHQVFEKKVYQFPDTFSFHSLKNLLPIVPCRYFAQYGNYTIFSNKEESIKTILTAIEEDNTWGKSRDFHNFNEHNLQEANVSIIVNGMDEHVDTLEHILSPLMQLPMSSLKWLSFQWSNLDDAYYTNINYAWNESEKIATKARRNTTNSLLKFTPIINHAEKAVQWFVEKEHEFSIRSKDNKDLWNRSISSVIVDDVQQVDYYNNSKLQYFFSTKNRLYIVDRLGRDVADYPIKLPYQNNFTNVVDYDGSKNYRWLTASGQNIYLYNKGGQLLDGWKPKVFEDTIVARPEHVRIGRSDFFIIPLKNGTIQVTKRNGESIPKFPIKLKTILKSEYEIEEGKRKSNTFIRLLSINGEAISITLDGIITKKQLKKEQTTQFYFVPNNQSGSYFAIHEKLISVYDKKGNTQFEIVNTMDTTIIPQIIISQRRKLFGLFHSALNQIVIYNEIGQAIPESPIETRTPLRTIQYKNTTYVYRQTNHGIEEVIFKN